METYISTADVVLHHSNWQSSTVHTTLLLPQSLCFASSLLARKFALLKLKLLQGHCVVPEYVKLSLGLKENGPGTFIVNVFVGISVCCVNKCFIVFE